MPELSSDTEAKKYFWCLGCERVSMTEQIEGFYFTCIYSGCPLHRVEDDRPFTIAARWTHLRSTYHLEYPETPEFGVRYPMLEFRERVATFEPRNPYLSRTAAT